MKKDCANCRYYGGIETECDEFFVETLYVICRARKNGRYLLDNLNKCALWELSNSTYQ